jgi:hypothetical protein
LENSGTKGVNAGMSTRPAGKEIPFLTGAKSGTTPTQNIIMHNIDSNDVFYVCDGDIS